MKQVLLRKLQNHFAIICEYSFFLQRKRNFLSGFGKGKFIQLTQAMSSNLRHFYTLLLRNESLFAKASLVNRKNEVIFCFQTLLKEPSLSRNFVY